MHRPVSNTFLRKFSTLTGLKYKFSSLLVGAYNATNVLAAIAVGRYFGVPLADAFAAISAYVPSNQRSQMLRTQRNTLIVDAYNANPSSMAVALDNFLAMRSARKLALLGEMRELGEASAEEHLKLVRRLSEAGVDACFVGEEFGRALDAAGLDRARWYPDSVSLAAALSGDDSPSDTLILVKGSRGTKMETVIPSL